MHENTNTSTHIYTPCGTEMYPKGAVFSQCVYICSQGDLTRYGERKFSGMMKDGYNSAHRSATIIII